MIRACVHIGRGLRTRKAPARPPAPRRVGFTLVELLVAITIIGMLAALATGALQLARQAAREAKTKSTITKINNIVLERYESYRTRQMRMAMPSTVPPPARSMLKLLALRQTMRLEMPERWTDVLAPGNLICNVPQSFSPPGDPYNPNSYVINQGYPLRAQYGAAQFNAGMYRPALSKGYLRRYARAWNTLTDAAGAYKLSQADAEALLKSHESAECLYLLVTMSSPASAEHFRENEVGDTDGDTLREFLDGWGQPIHFLRWAPGLTESDLQRIVYVESGATWAADASLMGLAEDEDHDPFDPMKVDRRPDPNSPPDLANNRPRAWRLLPFIFSAGRDDVYDVSQLAASGDYFWNNDTYTQDFGMPTDGGNDGDFGHYDNVHNHRVEARVR